MAKVFLSYDREDAEQGRRLALALERAGHSVWWDLNIRGGEQYSKAIEEALASAEAVVVLWSSASIESAWVRDEAASGRDRQCFVPVLIEPVLPPLGFRQYQNVDLTRWKGRGKSPDFRDLTAAIASLAKSPDNDAANSPKLTTAHRPTFYRLGLLFLVLVALVGGFWLVGRDGKSSAHTILVAPADASAAFLARDLLANLGSLAPAQSGILRLTGQNGGKEADLIVEATNSATPGETASGLVLKSGRDGGVLWSRQLSQPNGSTADLKQQMALTASRALVCSLEGLNAGAASPDQQTPKIYLDACVRSEEVGGGQGTQALIPIFRSVLEKAPRFKAAWAKLLLMQSDTLTAPSTERNPPGLEEMRRQLQKDISEARKVDPSLPEVRVAQAAQLPRRSYWEAIRMLDRAKESSPNNAGILRHRASALMRVGRLGSAIEDSKLAAETAPSSPRAATSYALTLAYSGRTAAASVALRRAERLFPEAPVLREARYDFHWHFGDPKIAMEITPPGLPQGREMFLRARADPSRANVDRFVDFIHAMYDRRGFVRPSAAILQEFAAIGREDELYERILNPRNDYTAPLDEVLFRPPLRNFRRDRRFMQVARREGVLEYWRKSGNWPDFCFEEALPYDCKTEAAKLA